MAATSTGRVGDLPATVRCMLRSVESAVRVRSGSAQLVLSMPSSMEVLQPCLLRLEEARTGDADSKWRSVTTSVYRHNVLQQLNAPTVSVAHSILRPSSFHHIHRRNRRQQLLCIRSRCSCCVRLPLLVLMRVNVIADATDDKTWKGVH